MKYTLDRNVKHPQQKTHPLHTPIIDTVFHNCKLYLSSAHLEDIPLDIPVFKTKNSPIDISIFSISSDSKTP